MKTYTARYAREGDAWVVLFDQIELSTPRSGKSAHRAAVLVVLLRRVLDRIDAQCMIPVALDPKLPKGM